MRKFISIRWDGQISTLDIDFIEKYIEQRMPISYKATTWFDALVEMFPQYSKSEITRRVKSGAYNLGEPVTLEESQEEYTLRKEDGKGFDMEIVKFGKDRGMVVFSELLRDYLQKSRNNSEPL